MSLDKWKRNVTIGWIFGLILATAVMFLIFLYGEKSLNITLLIFFATIRFMGGLGVVIGMLTIGIKILENSAENFKGKEHEKNLGRYYFGMMIFPIVLLGYGIYKIIASFVLGKPVNTIFDWGLFLFGVVSLLMTLYIIPIWKDEFNSVVISTSADMLKGSFKDMIRGVKKKFFKAKNDYAKAELQNQYKMKEELVLWRSRVGVVLLIVLGIGSFIFTPIFLILIVLWFRIFFFNTRAIFRFEKVILLIALIGILIISLTIPFFMGSTPFYQSIQSEYYILEMLHFFGVFFGSIAYYNKFMKSTINSYRLKRKSNEVESLKDKEDDYKQEIKDLKKENKIANENQEKNN